MIIADLLLDLACVFLAAAAVSQFTGVSMTSLTVCCFVYQTLSFAASHVSGR